MPEFTNPFIGNRPDRKLSPDELLRALRLDYAAEYEAVHIYMAQAEATDDPLAKKVLVDIADEERVHAGEFLRLINILTNGEEDTFLAEGGREVDEMASSLSTAKEGEAEKADSSAAPTIGSLKN